MPARDASNVSDQRDLESTLWRIADKLRGNLAPGEYRPLVLGLIFYKHVSDLCDARSSSRAKPTSQDIEVPSTVRWGRLMNRPARESIAEVIDSAMLQIEQTNPTIAGALPKDFANSGIDDDRLKGLVELVSTLDFGGPHASNEHDVLGRVYEYFLGQFAVAGGRAGEDYTPRSVVKLLVEMLEPFDGSVYDPCSGTGGMFVQSADFVAAHGGSPEGLRIFGQEFNENSLRLARMNLALRGLQADLGSRAADSLLDDLHCGRQFDFVIANPPFNVSDWSSDEAIARLDWPLGQPPTSNANFAWVSHFFGHLADGGHAGFVLANGALTSSNRQEVAIRQRLVEGGHLSCVVALPAKLFSNTGIPVSLWFLRKPYCDTSIARSGETLFIDARALGEMLNRRQAQLPDRAIERISGCYSAWLERPGAQPYEDVPGFCRSASAAAIREQRFLLTPGRYTGSAIDLNEPAETPSEEVRRLAKELLEQIAASSAHEAQISELLRTFR